MCLGAALWVAGGLPVVGHADARAPTVILISLDGTRPADVRSETMPHLAAVAARGTSAERLIGVVPSNTFPSHVSLATGVAPERHGLVNNTFEDRERGLFQKSEKDIPSWIEVEPVWSLLEGAGIKTASFYWVGSEGVWPGGHGPSEWKRFSSRTPESEKVDQILAWVDRPEAERPRLITAWFRGGDKPGHQDGPGAPSVERLLAKQDVEIGRLIAELERRGRLEDTTLLFVSDHGMASVNERVNLASELARHDGIKARVYGIGGFASVRLPDGQRDDPEAVSRVVARARALGLEAHARTDAPADWRVDHPRFGEVVVRAPLGTALVYPFLRIDGFHGYDPELPEMAGIFFALGRGVPVGRREGAVRSVDVAPTILRLLDQPVPPWMEGAPIASLLPAGSASATIAPEPRPAEAGGGSHR